MTIKSYLKNVLIGIDQLVNTFFAGYPDETLSSRAYRWHRDKIHLYPMQIIDTLFFMDTDPLTGKKHCELSYISEQERLQHPPELRKLAEKLEVK